MSQHLFCKHYWVSTKNGSYIQCIHCGETKEVDDAPMKPEAEHREAQ